MTPYIDDVDFKLYLGDVRDVLRQLPEESVHCCTTSPPYWAQRDYGTGKWEGGSPDCSHQRVPGGTGGDPKYGPNKGNAGGAPSPMGKVCIYCGAKRIDQQIGLESTPDEYVTTMVDVFREVKRVLRKDGTLWLNIGDSYSASPGQRKPTDKAGPKQMTNAGSVGVASASVPGLKAKDLVGIPWMLAFALRADGWYLRSEIVWHKPNAMPESINDRPTCAHEKVFLLSKSSRYFYDKEAVKEDAEWKRWGDQTNAKYNTDGVGKAGFIKNRSKSAIYEYMNTPGEQDGMTKNLRNVWSIMTQPYPEAHFATFPEALIEPCIKAGCPEGGVVLDPFIGSGTTAFVSRRLGRQCVGIELNEEYAKLIAKRTQQLSLTP